MYICWIFVWDGVIVRKGLVFYGVDFDVYLFVLLLCFLWFEGYMLWFD